ncbi:MAG: septum site-determining protein MinD [Synergistaceae bacterium]|nr:septum site-determining protein MinD [Synergistaceae bacterium]
MGARVIVVTSGKGGVGKTTSSANIAVALAKKGKKVVAVDTDTGLRCLDTVMGLESRIVYNLIDVVEKNCRLQQALVRDKRVENLYLLPTAQTRTKDAVTPDQMMELCAQLKADFDFVLLDCPAGIEGGFKNAASGADEALVVTTPEIPAVRSADRIIGMLESMGKDPIQLIINRFRAAMVQNNDMLSQDDILDVLSIGLVGVVPEDDSVIKSSNLGEPLTFTQNSPAAEAYANIAARLLGEDVPFLSLDCPSKGFFSGLKKMFGF